MALAATVAGLARKTSLSRLPMRPGKFRFVALMHFNRVLARPNVSSGPPRHAAQPAFSVIRTPASTSTCQMDFAPSFTARKSFTTCVVAGTPKVSMATLRPLTMRANATKSLVLPPVQEPI